MISFHFAVTKQTTVQRWKPAGSTGTGRVDRHRSGRPAGRVAGRVQILRPAGQAGWKTGQILLSGN